MENKIGFLAILLAITIALWFNGHHVPGVSGFFNHNHNVFKSAARPDLIESCPKVKAMRNFDITGMMGFWYIVQYYASSEEAAEYACMKCNFSMSTESAYITMNFTYLYKDDPVKDELQGNITWVVPDTETPGHWIHTEYIYEGIYNTYVIDTDYRTWALIMHCAEKSKSTRYLSALMLSREPELGMNVINYLREKLPQYDIDTSFMFAISQDECAKKTD